MNWDSAFFVVCGIVLFVTRVWGPKNPEKNARMNNRLTGRVQHSIGIYKGLTWAGLAFSIVLVVMGAFVIPSIEGR